jgi:hypothetical protein
VATETRPVISTIISIFYQFRLQQWKQMKKHLEIHKIEAEGDM